MIGRFAVSGLAALVMACSTQTASQPSSEANAQSAPEAAAERHPTSGLAIIPVTIARGETAHVFRTELANTPEAQSRGLMFRTEMGDDEAMLFPSEPPSARSFWMKNTPIALDIIFIGVDGRISNIAAETEPYSLLSVQSVGLTSAVLELRGGRVEELGIRPGDRVEW